MQTLVAAADDERKQLLRRFHQLLIALWERRVMTGERNLNNPGGFYMGPLP